MESSKPGMGGLFLQREQTVSPVPVRFSWATAVGFREIATFTVSSWIDNL